MKNLLLLHMLKNHLASSMQRRTYTFFFLCLLWVSAGAGSAMAIDFGSYPTTTVVAGQNATITPTTAPTGVTSMVAYTNTNFTGVLSVNPTTGVVNVINAKQAGTYTVTVKAFDGAASASTTFTLNVTNPVCSQGILGTATSFAPGAYLYGIATGDFNGDGKQDLAVAVNGSGRVSIHLGSGTGTFGAGTTFSAGTGTASVAVGDFNGDGRQDIATANLSGNNVSILLGNGAGSFGAATNYSVGTQPFQIALGDFNNDGHQDFATANASGQNISVALGTGTGTFGATTNFALGVVSTSIAVGDFNNDGNQDLAANKSSANQVSILLGTGTGSFGVPTDFGVGSYPIGLAVGDFNNDGNQDFATANFQSGSSGISIRLGTGTGSFGAVTGYSLAGQCNSVSVGDFNGDGKQDLVVPNFSTDNISVFMGTGTGTFGSPTSYSMGDQSRNAAIGDFNNDGRQDVAVTSDGGSAPNSVYIRLGTATASEINVRGGSPLTDIPDGDNTPTAAKGTDFGNVNVSNNVVKTFTVQNTGSANLNISSISSNNGRFTIGALSPASSITAGGSATFTVRFSPTAPGGQNATITVNSNDCDEAVYDFAVTGNGACPVITINAPTVTQPTCTTPTGSIVVNATGSGTLEYSIDNGSTWQSSATFGDLAAGNYNIKVRSQATPSCEATYASNPVVISPKTPPSVDAGSCQFVYNGYGSNCTNLTASATGDAGGFTYSWSPGNLSGATVEVCPTVTTTYTVTVTDANGCTSTDEVTVEVIDVRCGNSNAVEKVLVCFGGKALCVAPTAVPALLANGATLGACGITPCGTQSNARMGVESDEATRPMALMMQVYPNPTAGLVTVDLRNVSKGLARIEVVDLIGRPLVQKAEQMNEGANQLSFDFKQLPEGLYLIRCRDSQNHEAVVKVNKL